MPAPKPPNALADLLLTVVLPSVVLEWLSEPQRLGPFWALVVASLLPLGFGIYCHYAHNGLNFLSVFGLAAVVITGGLGLLKLDAFWFAIKEVSVPVILGLAFPASHRFARPLIESILLTPHVVNRAALQRALVTPEQQRTFAALLLRASWGMGAGMLVSAVANFFLALHLLGGKEPGGEAFVKGIGTLNWAGFIIIGVPMFAMMFVVLVWFLRAVQKLTGLERDDLMNPGKTVRRQVTNEP
ncbi:MAG: hypothetical protein K1X78_17075 [Verrucomicrobiaceae bacterium]|nr:hypothetical protein [Verrucomicrobiaceae bacterium]